MNHKFGSDTSTIGDASEQQLADAHRLLAEVFQLLDDYAPVWYSEDLHDRLQATLSASKKRTPQRV